MGGLPYEAEVTVFCEDKETFSALNALVSEVRGGHRPLVVWLGAGASAWAGYPLWRELAEAMHIRFGREVVDYRKDDATALLSEARYPRLFQRMRDSDLALYFSCLRDAFAYRQPTPVHERLLRSLGLLTPRRIMTTNVDESLERNLTVETIQRSDAELIPQLLTQGKSFVAKLHGSVSAVESMVFCARDYEEIKKDASLINSLCSTFEVSTVLFLGYGLQDQHVIAALHDSRGVHPLYGTGPHFVVTPEGTSAVLQNVRRISYVTDPPDHRGALLTLEAVADVQVAVQPTAYSTSSNAAKETKGESACFIGDLLPWGKMTTSQTLTATSASGQRQLIVGEGYVDGEVSFHNYSALNDLVVGLICFDVVYVSLDHLGTLHGLLGSTWFWKFVEAKAIRLVVPPYEPVVMFSEPDRVVGEIGSIDRGSKSSTTESFESRTTSERIHEFIAPIPGREVAAERLMDMLESTTVDLSRIVTSERLSAMARGAMMNPSVRRLLGISGGTPVGTVPRWLTFPVIRLAGVIRKGIICRHVGARSTRMILGSETLASIAFSAVSGREWADDAASYVLTGRFNSDLGALIEEQPALLEGVLRFRESAAGSGFRREVTERLATNDGGQMTAAVNGGLREALPMATLQRARDQLSGLFMPRAAGPSIQPAVWGDLRNGEARVAGWRKRSRDLLNNFCKENGYRPYDPCPCGSGEKLKFCCSSALRRPHRLEPRSEISPATPQSPLPRPIR